MEKITPSLDVEVSSTSSRSVTRESRDESTSVTTSHQVESISYLSSPRNEPSFTSSSQEQSERQRYPSSPSTTREDVSTSSPNTSQANAKQTLAENMFEDASSNISSSKSFSRLGLDSLQETSSTTSAASPVPTIHSTSNIDVIITTSRGTIGYDSSVSQLPPSETPVSTPPSPSLSSSSFTFDKLQPNGRISRICSGQGFQGQDQENKVEEYSGMPKVDDDIEVGKKIVRRRKLSTACPPSSHHADIRPPSLTLVQYALRAHRAAGARKFKRVQPQAVVTEFHDEKGHMFLYGSEEGKYVGDVLGGLPHGHGQHWIAKRCVHCGEPLGDLHMLYEGAWEYGTKQGFGRMIYTNGQEYRGHFKGGERHGHGTMRYVDGSIFDGEWSKGRKNGLGSCYYEDGGIFKGAYSSDNRDGWGIYYWPNKCRRYEGEWVGDDPVCGNATNIEEKEYNIIVDSIPNWCEAKKRCPQLLPKETTQLPFQTLRNPELCYYPHVCARRQHRIDLKKAALKAPPDPKIVVEHRGSLTPQQMEGLRLAFDKLSPGYYRRTMVNKIQLRRLILLARLDPDSEMGKMLLNNLKEATTHTVGLTYNNFMKTILSFQHPSLF